MDRLTAANSPSARFLIADDHAMFAETLKSYLEREFTVVGLVADGRSLIAEALRVKPDLIIVDISMPFLNGLDAARRIHEQALSLSF